MGRYFAPLSRRKAIEAPGPDAYAHQAQRGQAYSGGHAAHLAVTAFADGELQPGRGDALAKAHGRVAFP